MQGIGGVTCAFLNKSKMVWRMTWGIGCATNILERMKRTWDLTKRWVLAVSPIPTMVFARKREEYKCKGHNQRLIKPIFFKLGIIGGDANTTLGKIRTSFWSNIALGGTTNILWRKFKYIFWRPKDIGGSTNIFKKKNEFIFGAVWVLVALPFKEQHSFFKAYEY